MRRYSREKRVGVQGQAQIQVQDPAKVFQKSTQRKLYTKQQQMKMRDEKSSIKTHTYVIMIYTIY